MTILIRIYYNLLLAKIYRILAKLCEVLNRKLNKNLTEINQIIQNRNDKTC